MTEATTYGYKRAAMERAHAERSAIITGFFARFFTKADQAPHSAAQAA